MRAAACHSSFDPAKTRMDKTPRLAVRGLIVIDGRLLLVNAFRTSPDRLWCLPGGGVEPGSSLPDNLRREIHEECGLVVAPEIPVLVNEFHDPAGGFHQVEIVFRCAVIAGRLDPDWQDPEQIVSQRRLFSRAELQDLPVKPSVLKTLPWDGAALSYDPLEVMVKAPGG